MLRGAICCVSQNLARAMKFIVLNRDLKHASAVQQCNARNPDGIHKNDPPKPMSIDHISRFGRRWFGGHMRELKVLVSNSRRLRGLLAKEYALNSRSAAQNGMYIGTCKYVCTRLGLCCGAYRSLGSISHSSLLDLGF